MLEETIKELCRLTEIPEEKISLSNRTDAYFKNKEFALHHYKTTELEGITLACIHENLYQDDIEVDFILDASDESLQIDIKVQTYYLIQIRKLAEEIEDKNNLFKEAKKRIATRAFPCEDPYDTQVVIPIMQGEQKDAAEFAYSLINAQLSKLKMQKKQEEEARKKRGKIYGTVDPAV